MDIWKFFAVGHQRHVFCNPLSGAKIDELIELLELSEGSRVLDVGCGKGEFLVRTATRWKCSAVGVDISPYFAADARANIQSAGLGSSIDIVEASGSDYQGAESSFDAAVCLGASWIWGGFEGTLAALSRWARPGGLIVVGEPFWKRGPSPEHLDASSLTEESFDTHFGNIRTALRFGFALLHTIVSNRDDWDRYEGYQWHAAEAYAKRNAADPDVPEILEGIRGARDRYLQWGRNEIGWAAYLFRRDSDAPAA